MNSEAGMTNTEAEGKFAKCPLCGSETVEGLIQSRDTLGWSKKKRLVASLAGLVSDERLGCDVVAHNCPSCKAIFIDYADL